MQRLPVLVLINFRPEFISPWHGQAHVTSLTLNRLGRARGASMVADLTGGKTLPSEVLTEMLAAAFTAGAAGKWMFSRPLADGSLNCQPL